MSVLETLKAFKAPRQARRLVSDVRGTVAVVFAVSLLPVMLVLGGAVDYSRLVAEKAELQSALDGAVLAGVSATAGTQTSVGLNTLKAELGTHSAYLTTTSFVVNADGSLTGQAALSLPMTFMKIANVSSQAIIASSTAAASAGASTGNKVCILIKDPSSSQTLLVNSGVTINAPQCEIDVASTATTAAMINNGSGINVASLCVASNSVTVNGSAPANLKKSCTTATDPFAGNLPVVSSGACTVSNQNYSGTNALSPGVYCGNFNFNGSGTLNLAAGLYVLKGAHWNLNSGWTVNGTGVTFYFADNSSYIQVNSGVAINMSAPTTGTYANILMYEPTGLGISSFTINGSAGHTLTGLIYLPSRNITFNSMSNVSSESVTMVFNQLILDTINWSFATSSKSISAAGSTTTAGGSRLSN